jgi:ADP-heptose:LPS heptosyltransferase
VGKTFGIGNAILSVPMIKAIRSEHPEARIDVLVGNLPDDGGAIEVMRYLRYPDGIIDGIYVNQALEVEYDVAIMAIPFDGRWANGRDFRAKTVLDGRPRPDPKTFGLTSWSKHEIEYQMENAHFLGYDGPTPSCSFFEEPPLWSKELFDKSIYMGVGYKKDAAGLWKVKHYGNENYAQLCRLLLLRDPDVRVVVTGDQGDMVLSIKPIQARLKEWGLQDRFVVVSTPTLRHAFAVVNSCHLYVGNDTGMMHVAAACDRAVVGIFNMENAIVKNPPFCKNSTILEGWKDPIDVEDIIMAINTLRLVE